MTEGEKEFSFCDPLDKKQMPAGEGPEGSATNRDLCIEACQTHHPKIILHYCKAHDEPGCEDCMTIKHTSKSCKVERVQDISKGFKQTEEFKDIDQELQQFNQEVEEMTGVLADNLVKLNASYDNAVQIIESVPEQKNEILDPLKKELTEKATEMKEKYEKKLKKLIEENESMKSELDVIIQSINNDSDVDENSVFLITKQAKQRLPTMRSDFTIINQSLEHNYESLISDEIERILSAKTTLGTLTEQPKRSKRKKGQRTTILPNKHAKTESTIQL